MERENGLYYVCYNNTWRFGFWFKSQNRWFIKNHDNVKNDSQFNEIDELPINKQIKSLPYHKLLTDANKNNY